VYPACGALATLAFYHCTATLGFLSAASLVAWNNNSGALCNVAAASMVMLHVAAVARYS